MAVGLPNGLSEMLPVALGVAGGMLFVSTIPQPLNARKKISKVKLYIHKRMGLFLNPIENWLVAPVIVASKTGVILRRALPGADPGRHASHHPAN